MTSLDLIRYLVGGGVVIILLSCFSYLSVNFFVKQFTERTRDKFREHLAQEVEQAIRVFREGMCEQIVLQGKKSDSLASLYSMLIDMLRLGKEFATNCVKGDPLLMERRLRSLNETCTKFFELYQKESLHFSDEFCVALDGFMGAHQEVMQGIEKEFYRKDAAGRNEAEIRQNWLRFEDGITAVMDTVRKEFHRRNQAPGNYLQKGFHDMMSQEAAPSAQARS